MQVPKFLLTQTCLIDKYLGESATGPTFDTQYSAICRFEEESKIFRKENAEEAGVEFISKGVLFLSPTAANLAITKKSKVTIDSVVYIVEEKYTRRSMKKISHVECILR